MDDQKQKVIDSLKQANNILVTVRNSPSIDQLAACIALTLIVNELGKHGTAVFSGRIPSTLEFLEPDKTLERNTDSLRDFIISLDKAKADKLRYKVEDTVVKVFITPYRTSLTPDDLEFSQGDFNVDVVVALGVHNQNDLDEAITAHGRILHDATVISLNTEGGAVEDLGSINWNDGSFSSLSEMVFSFVDKLGKEDVVDNQVATALLTGIVAETGRFSNSKTTPETMEAAAKLLTAGANQELVAAKLSEPERPDEPPQDAGSNHDDGGTPPTPPVNGGKDGELDIEHTEDEQPHEEQPAPPPPPPPQPQPPQPPEPPQQQAYGSPFAQENTSFDIPQETAPAAMMDPEDRPSGEPDPNLPQQNIAPPIIDLNQPPAVSGEEMAALEYIKEHQIPDSRARLEPLHSPGELLDAPKIIPDHIRPIVTAPPASPNSNDDALNARFALTPPSMGGTLTANMPENEPGYDALLDAPKSTPRPMLSHDAHPDPAAEERRPEPTPDPTPAPEPAPAPPPPNPAPAPTPPPAAPAPEPPKLEAAAPVAQPQLDAAPLSPEEVDQQMELEAVHQDQQPAPQYTTLEDLEKQVHAHGDEPAPAAQPVLQAAPANLPPAGAQDMPAPATVKLPAPQTASPTSSPTASPLAPPPPVPPPLPSV